MRPLQHPALLLPLPLLLELLSALSEAIMDVIKVVCANFVEIFW